MRKKEVCVFRVDEVEILDLEHLGLIDVSWVEFERSTMVTSGFTSNTTAVTAKFDSYMIETSSYALSTAEFESSATATFG
ncbi:hypothetical protein TIFTF001_023750 [Ficus carica]|uniref:Uncharacterized protein n=1 Tax=Ficus carica TaxID=3494 RepID=A0AA88AGT2_FICCA|nr:hypothetical protein TIFTF001_023750 [Ficus carica]